jgi:hypothetical protein
MTKKVDQVVNLIPVIPLQIKKGPIHQVAPPMHIVVVIHLLQVVVQVIVEVIIAIILGIEKMMKIFRTKSEKN